MSERWSEVEEWLSIVIRQMVLYSLPVLVSLTLVTMLEARWTRIQIPHPFYAIAWRGAWVPLLASLFFHRGVIIALPNYLQFGVKSAALRCLVHLILFGVGFLLYSWSLSYQAPSGLPPLHHWWAKVLMFFNLCMAALHLLPLPLLLLGECLEKAAGIRFFQKLALKRNHAWLLIAAVAASPLLDMLLGAYLVYPVYEEVSSYATYLWR
ncbi:hypothetical protein MMIC_P1422 [Mariprofundus micogutta]|uniref:Uncharacterized protein n=1 Tax=Mariprofundus micogutta TaxID=1921010 RepID=A0A1L8CNH9_9PROT|nr:hypothetical protein [Mariprofundus micogutta]GAV20457.1 hypothetical protein MMIC_P1422 [Mariprofundus micogutta]